MKATIEGKVLAKKIQEPKPGSTAKTKYILAIHQPGETELATVECSSDQYGKIKENEDVKLPVTISAWKTERSYGLNTKALQ